MQEEKSGVDCDEVVIARVSRGEPPPPSVKPSKPDPVVAAHVTGRYNLLIAVIALVLGGGAISKWLWSPSAEKDSPPVELNKPKVAATGMSALPESRVDLLSIEPVFPANSSPSKSIQLQTAFRIKLRCVGDTARVIATTFIVTAVRSEELDKSYSLHNDHSVLGVSDSIIDLKERPELASRYHPGNWSPIAYPNRDMEWIMTFKIDPSKQNQSVLHVEGYFQFDYLGGSVVSPAIYVVLRDSWEQMPAVPFELHLIPDDK